MTKPETPLQRLSYALDCLTLIVEDTTIPESVKLECEIARDHVADAMLDLQTTVGPRERPASRQRDARDAALQERRAS